MYHTICLLWFSLYLISPTRGTENFIEDFTKDGDTSEWVEHSDTVRREGKSKANLLVQETTTFRRALLFTLLDPQPCGAAFAGVKKPIKIDFNLYSAVSLKARVQGQYKGYKIILNQAGRNYSFSNFFEASGDYQAIRVPLEGFKPHYHGKPVTDPAAILDKSQVESIGIQAYGGRYLPVKQSGVSCLEIEWIKLE